MTGKYDACIIILHWYALYDDGVWGAFVIDIILMSDVKHSENEPLLS